MMRTLMVMAQSLLVGGSALLAMWQAPPASDSGARASLGGGAETRRSEPAVIGAETLPAAPIRLAERSGPTAAAPRRAFTPIPTLEPFPIPDDLRGVDLSSQTPLQAHAKSAGCVCCHQGVGDMHNSKTVNLGCTDCHGGDATATTKQQAHVAPRFPDAWTSAANPVRSYTLLNHESPEFVRFVNPGDLRVAHIACGQCHGEEVLKVRKSMMTHGAMLWGAALYNNGAIPNKWPAYGESYSMCGTPQRVQTVPPPRPQDTDRLGVLPYLDPLPRFEMSQPGNVLRIFERGGRFRPEIGVPERLEEPGRPRERLSVRGLGTENRTDPVFIGLQKTRLLDPTLNFLGTNDHPGDYRSSGCTACHVLYANDRSPVNSGPYARYGNRGLAAAAPDEWVRSVDPTIPKNEPGHPIQHRFVMSPPTSQCIVCHVHPGTNVLNSYCGFMWWDNETDGELMYPKEEMNPSAEQYAASLASNPDETAARGLWSDPEFLARVADLNPQARHTQFADFHGHGWVYRAVFKKDRDGVLLDHQGRRLEDVATGDLMRAVAPPTREEYGKGKHRDDTPVHLMDIHLEKGMHCSDCHFNQDSHGNTLLYGEVRAAIEIQCIDCHGTSTESLPQTVLRESRRGEPLRLTTSGPASNTSQLNLLALRTPFNQPRFEVRQSEDGRTILLQRSVVDPELSWEVVQTADTIDPDSPKYNAKSHMAKTVRMNERGDLVWGDEPERCAHQDSNMSCIACHSSWNPSCFGCHLPQKANRKAPSLHNEGDVSRNLVAYNFQTLRDDVYMLARDGNVTGNRIGPARSSCAIHVTSYNQNREAIYVQQQTISAEGLSGIAFSSNVPHTVRGGPGYSPSAPLSAGVHETKMCTDCHLSVNDDNNAIMAQLLMQGTNYTNFIGRYCWVAAGEHGLEAVVVTEQEEPQAVIGSSLHQLAYPERHRRHLRAKRELRHSHEHPGKDILSGMLRPLHKPEIRSLQARGEYLYAACGEDGFRVFDIAFIDHKGFSERITTAPVSPIGQRFFVKTKDANFATAPTTLAPDPTRTHRAENHEAKVHPLYAYIYVADGQEGLILVGAGTLLDGNPLNNYLERAVTFNPDGLLRGARHISFAGVYAYVACDAGVVVIDLDDPEHPRVVHVIGEEVHCPTATQVQFRYLFACDHEGLKVFDITSPEHPQLRAELPLPECHNVYVARTRAYVAGGKCGLIIVDVENPERPVVEQVFDADGEMDDVHDVKLGITNISQFAYVADGENGLRIVQLTSAETPGNDGFSPRPTPELIATYRLPGGGHALAVAEGLDRDRAVDESGNQLAVFGRVGARPFNLQEQRRMYLRADGSVYKVSDDPFDARVYRTIQQPPGANARLRQAAGEEAGEPAGSRARLR